MLNRTIKLYYHVKPLIPRWIQVLLRKRLVQWRLKFCKDVWPINEGAKNPPEGWSGWPDNKQFALVLTHDVETARGQEKCFELMQSEKSLGFRSSFNFVAEEYDVKSEVRNHLTNHGFEVGVHGLRHDGKLYHSREKFKEQAEQINRYLKEWDSIGFRSPSMHCNLEWIHDLDIEYDASTFDTDPFEPQPKGLETIFPLFISGKLSQKGYVELPYTLPQDFTLFILLNERNINIWRKKLDWIYEQGGMALLNTHPDYMKFSGNNQNITEYPAHYYKEFLEYIKSKYEGRYWHCLPKEITHFWRAHYGEQ